MYIAVKELPPYVRGLLEGRGYRRPDIAVMPKEEVSVSDAGSAGQRAYTIIVNMETQQNKIHIGSWGGSNMFNPNNLVDLDKQVHTIPLNGMVIKGSEGHRFYATIYVRSCNLAKYLPKVELVTEDERSVLTIYHTLKSGLYRKQALECVSNSANIIISLVGRKLLKQSKNGATRITTEGKNALR